jgi:two-component system sensor histidine kinase YesM
LFYSKSIISSDGFKIGIYNVEERIKVYFGEKYGISFASKQGEGTTVTVKLPILKPSDDIMLLE